MGCCISSPHSRRRYRDPADLDEEIVPLRYFGSNRVGSNLVPDDIEGLPSTHLKEHLASNKDVILYNAEIDHAWLLANSAVHLCSSCSCDEACCWLRKEYSTRTYLRIYSNRIEVNNPAVRFPYGYLGCGSWNGDKIIAHPFDRGAFGFQQVRIGSVDYICCCCPVYGGVMARHRCQCNGPLWNRTDGCGWWCDEWCCLMFCCVYQYRGLTYPDEVSFAASIALQAYFEGRAITPGDMRQCLVFWKQNISEREDPVGRKRPVCCEPYYVPMPDCAGCYRGTHLERRIPYEDEDVTAELRDVYEKYEKERLKQIESYETYYGPVQNSTLCRQGGWRRCYGRKGFCFCTEGCKSSYRKEGEPAPPFDVHDFDDEWDASGVLMKVLGPPPPNVVIRRWRWDPEKGENFIETYPDDSGEISGKSHDA